MDATCIRPLVFLAMKLSGKNEMYDRSSGRHICARVRTKSKVRSRLTNKNLESCLKRKTTSYETHLPKLRKVVQNSH